MKKHFLISLTLLLTLGLQNAYAQFNQKVTPTKQNTIDSVRVTNTPEVEMTIYSEAYQKYLKSVQFKERNKITIKNTGVSLNQASLTNWAAGGQNSFSARFTSDITHTYTNQGNFSVASVFQSALSLVQSDEDLRKSEDWWKINIKPSWKVSNKWSFSGDLLLNSQLASNFTEAQDGSANLISTIFAPATLNISAGFTFLDHRNAGKTNESKFTLYLSPAAGNLLMVLNEQLSEAGAFGVEAGKRFKPTFGMTFRAEFFKKFYEGKLDFYTKWETYWDYKVEPTIWWENRINFRISSIMGLNFTFISKYNTNDTPPYVQNGGNKFWDWLQINQSLGLTFSLNYQSKTPTKIDGINVKPLNNR